MLGQMMKQNREVYEEIDEISKNQKRAEEILDDIYSEKYKLMQTKEKQLDCLIDEGDIDGILAKLDEFDNIMQGNALAEMGLRFETESLKKCNI